jgi:membrane protein YdbS with pleckstrin-like domain
MTDTENPRRISRPRVALMIAIDVVAVAIAIALYLWLLPRDPDAAVLGAVAPLVFGAFFNLVIALVSLKP